MARVSTLLMALVMFLLLPGARSQANATDQAREFFKGKTIVWMVGSPPGGTVDRFSRLLAPFFSRYTGAKVILQNRAAGSGAAMYNYLYKYSKRDGLELGFHGASTQILGRIAGRPGHQFKLEELSWVGVVGPTANTFMAYAKRFQSLEDVKKATELRYGLSGRGGNNHFMGVTLARVLGLNIRFVSGYLGSSGVRQALMSGEIDVVTGNPTAYVSAIKEGIVVPLVHMGRTRHPAAPDTPTLFEMVKTIQSPLDTWVDVGEVGYFLAGPPEIPEQRLQFLRTALKQVISDPEFLKNADKQRVVVGYLAPDIGLDVARKMLHMPENEQQQLRGLLTGGK